MIEAGELRKYMELQLRELIEEERMNTGYNGRSERFAGWVDDREFEPQIYETIGYCSGAIDTLLCLAGTAKIALDPRLRKRAASYIYTGAER